MRVRGFEGSRVRGFEGSRVRGFEGVRGSGFPVLSLGLGCRGIRFGVSG